MMKPPFPWFGGKSRAASMIWERFGDVPNYVEPFAGSLAVLLNRPHVPRVETVNDLDCFLANFWRATQRDPEAVARWCDEPVNEADLTARHVWLVNQQEFRARMAGDPDYYDTKIAGWWVWGLCCWIGSGWCSGNGPWVNIDGALTNRQLPHLGNAGQGVNRQLPHLGNAGQGVNRKLPHLGDAGRGVNRKLPHLGDAGRGRLYLLAEIAERIRNVRVACGDWSRVLGRSVTTNHGMTAVLLDPPYADTAKRCGNLYANDSETVAYAVREWAIEHGDDPKMRIALCGYEGEHEIPATWECVPWKAKGGYGSQSKAGNDNCKRERIWFSPHCLRPMETQTRLSI